MKGKEKDAGCLGRDQDVSLRDDVPLVDHHQLEERHIRVEDVVEVVAAVMVLVKLRPVQFRVAAKPAKEKIRFKNTNILYQSVVEIQYEYWRK